MRPHLAQLLLAAGLASASACSLGAFNISLSGQTTISGDPAGAGTLLTRIPAIGSFASIDLTSSEEFRRNGITSEAVQSFKLSAATLAVVRPPTQGFGFLDAVELHASAGGKEEPVAWKSGIAELGLDPPGPVLFLDVEPAPELRDFLGSPSLSLTLSGSGRQPPQDTTLEASVTLRVVLEGL